MAPGTFYDLDIIATPRSARPVPPYPGYDFDEEYLDDAPVPRVKGNAEEYLIRNRGSIDSWAFHGCTTDASPRPVPRCPTDASVQNWTIGRHGTIKPVIDGVATPRPETAPPRIKSEAKGIANVSQGGRMCNLLTKYGQFGATPIIGRVKSEAEDTAELHKGGRMNKLVHSYGKLPLSARGVPRVKQEAEENADLDKGKRMNKLIHSYGKLPMSARAVPRVKQEATDNADLDKGKRMNGLLHKYGRLPLSSRAPPRVKQEGEPNADLDKGKRMDRLVHSCSSLPVAPRDPPRIKHVEGKNIYTHGKRGSMGKVLREMGQRTCIYTPGVKKKFGFKTSTM